VLTRSDLVAPQQRETIESAVHGYNHAAPIYRARHELVALRCDEAQAPFGSPEAAAPARQVVATRSTSTTCINLDLSALLDRRFFAVAGIANPNALNMQLKSLPGEYVGHHWFDDHYNYDNEDLVLLREEARGAGADVIVTTEKDWVKLRRLDAGGAGIPLVRLELDIRFEARSEQGLVELIQARLEKARSAR
jgi:tetraacyldisaccharide-1-P 4'-kinase